MDLKEKILQKFSDENNDCFHFENKLDLFDGQASTIFKAMDELSKIVAIAFAKWCMDNTFQDMNTENSWCASDKGIAYNRYTDEQLYKLFTQSKEYKELMNL